jgi:hypothetical protein
MLYGCTIYTVLHQRFQHSSLCISPLGFLSSGCSKLPQSMLYGRTTQAVPDIGFSLSSLRMLATLPAILRLPSTSWTADDPYVARHDIGSSVRPLAFRPRSSLSYDFLGVPPTSLLAVINALRLHITRRGSRHRSRFQRSSLTISAARPPSESRAFIHASVHLARPKLRRRPDASPSSRP